MANIKYKCPLCERSAVIKTICPVCTRPMVEVCARCDRPVKNCICGTDLEPPKPKTEIPYDYEKIVYRCPDGCGDEAKSYTECGSCNKAMVEVIICSICGETAENCYCDYEAIKKEAEESEEETGEETEGAEEESKESQGIEEKD
ncbi:MAG: hypothetical protein V3R82_00025 [Candidatus Hydrothermarchaeales archaeon]